MNETEIFLKELTGLSRKYRLSIRGGNFHGLPCLTQINGLKKLYDGKYTVDRELENLRFSFSVNDQVSSVIQDKKSADAINFLKDLTALTHKCGLIIKGPENGTSGALYLKEEHDPWIINDGEYHVNNNLEYLSYSAFSFD
jgi:hypothetical protein